MNLLPAHPEHSRRLLASAGELPAAEQAAIDAHLRTCTQCRLEAGRDADILQALRAPAVGAPDDTLTHARARRRLSHALDHASRPAPARVTFRWMALAAAAIVALALYARTSPASNVSLDVLPHGTLPVAHLTPGATIPVGLSAICTGETLQSPAVPDAVRIAVLEGYGMAHVPAHEYELDYLITPELGGATDAANLWPERYTGSTWNARVKDHLELLLPRMVCAGEVDLAEAQVAIARNWVAAYQKYFKTRTPLREYADGSWLGRASVPAARLVAFNVTR